MNYADIKFNDVANGEGVGVSVFLQGCPHHCKNCFNPETWDFNGGKQFTMETLNSIINGINENGIMRHLSILGGEPLCPDNTFLTDLIITEVKKVYPNIIIYVWSGYTYEELQTRTEPTLINILDNIDFLIDGRYEDDLRNLNLKLRGSSNQRIWDMKAKEIIS